MILTLDSLVAELPVSRRAMLAAGPVPDDDAESETGCRVCDALLDIEERNEAAGLLLDFHELEGLEGEACYRRCCAIYRAAGWDGEE